MGALILGSEAFMHWEAHQADKHLTGCNQYTVRVDQLLSILISAFETGAVPRNCYGPKAPSLNLFKRFEQAWAFNFVLLRRLNQVLRCTLTID